MHLLVSNFCSNSSLRLNFAPLKSNQQVLGRRNRPKVWFYDKKLDKSFASAPKKSLGIYKCHTGTKNRQPVFRVPTYHDCSCFSRDAIKILKLVGDSRRLVADCRKLCHISRFCRDKSVGDGIVGICKRALHSPPMRIHLLQNYISHCKYIAKR